MTAPGPPPLGNGALRLAAPALGLRPDPWLWCSLAVACLVLLPVVALLVSAAAGSSGLWSHMLATVLPHALWNTTLLLVGVGLLVIAIGTGSAWLVTAYDFPGRRMLSWALLLPLAMPTYIVAFAYLDLLHPLGPVQGAIRGLLGYESPRDFRLPDIRHLGSCIVLLGFVLYPYVYLTTRALFATQAASLLEAGRSLGAGRIAVFWRVVLPLARPAIAIGAVLALLETLNDIGASTFLGVQTLTVSIYTTWVTRGDLAGAAQIALAMLVIVVLLITLERYGRRRQRYAASHRPRPLQPLRLHGSAAALAFGLGAFPVVVGFIAPAGYLAWQAMTRLQGAGVSAQLWSAAWNTLYIAAIATLVTVTIGLVVAWALRRAQLRRRTRLAALSSRVASLGYAIPGTVLAIGLLVPVAWFDDAANLLLAAAGEAPRMVLMGSVAALVVAYVVRFLAVSIGSTEAGLTRIAPSLDQAAASLGERSLGTLRRIHLPLLRPALAAGALLVFVDTMKELPATLVLRPMNFETLATWLYAEAARGTYEEGAVAALLIVLVGVLPVILLARAYVSRGDHR